MELGKLIIGTTLTSKYISPERNVNVKWIRIYETNPTMLNYNMRLRDGIESMSNNIN